MVRRFLPVIVLVGSLSALVFVLIRGGASKDARIPFGPFLSAGIGAVWLAQRAAPLVPL